MSLTTRLYPSKIVHDTTEYLGHDSSGRDPLMMAAAGGWVQAVTLLLRKGADIYRVDQNGQSALMWASQFGRHSIIEILLRNGADALQRDNKGRNSLMLANCTVTKEFLLRVAKEVEREMLIVYWTMFDLTDMRRQQKLVEAKAKLTVRPPIYGIPLTMPSLRRRKTFDLKDSVPSEVLVIIILYLYGCKQHVLSCEELQSLREEYEHSNSEHCIIL